MSRRRQAGVEVAQTEANVIRTVEALRRAKRRSGARLPARQGWKAAGLLIGASLFIGLLIVAAVLIPR